MQHLAAALAGCPGCPALPARLSRRPAGQGQALRARRASTIAKLVMGAGDGLSRKPAPPAAALPQQAAVGAAALAFEPTAVLSSSSQLPLGHQEELDRYRLELTWWSGSTTPLEQEEQEVAVVALSPLQQQLRRLNLSYCGLPELPRELSACSGLTWLDLTGNRQLRAGWQHLQRLHQLERLDLRCCGVIEVPPMLAAHTGLTWLDLAGNGQLRAGWHHLLPLVQLSRLDLRGCGLTEMPQELSALGTAIHL